MVTGTGRLSCFCNWTFNMASTRQTRAQASQKQNLAEENQPDNKSNPSAASTEAVTSSTAAAASPKGRRPEQTLAPDDTDETTALERRLKEIEEEERVLLIRRKILDAERRVAAQRQALEGDGNTVTPTTVAGVVHQQSTSMDVEALPARKCTLGEESQLKVPDPPYYKGSGQREFTDWIRKVEQVFRVRSVSYEADSDKILLAVSYLTCDPADAWYRYEKEAGPDETFTWTAFKDFLQEEVKPASFRVADVQRQ